MDLLEQGGLDAAHPPIIEDLSAQGIQTLQEVAPLRGQVWRGILQRYSFGDERGKAVACGGTGCQFLRDIHSVGEESSARRRPRRTGHSNPRPPKKRGPTGTHDL